jgi:calcineurin-like phosphoesterase family protein
LKKPIEYLLIILALANFVFASCNLNSLQILDGGIGTNTFIMPLETTNSLIASSDSNSSFSFLITTDHHFSRKDSGVWYAEDEFFSWLETYQRETISNPASHLDLMVSLGDCTENSLEEEFLLYRQFLDHLAILGITSYSVKGNHDIRQNVDSSSLWDQYVQDPPYQAFSYKGVSFYLLDTSARTLGRTQLNQLREALPLDPNPKILCSHIPLYGKPELVYFSLPSTQEREEILALMKDNKAGIYLGGHQHFGDFSYQYSNTMSEAVLGTFHGRSSLIETTLPRWYVCRYDSKTALLTITRYQVDKESKTIDSSFIQTFKMPR